MPGRLLSSFVVAALVCPAGLYAQTQSAEIETVAPAHVSHVEGSVSLEREGRAESSPLNMPLLSGDRLRTVDGRVEVLFADGSTLHLDARSTLDVQSDDLVRLTEGRLRLNILGPQRAVTYRVDSPAGSARITQPGEYRIAFLRNSTDAQLELAVVRGAAEVFTDLGATPVRAGERAYASAGLMPSYAYAYNSASQDAFDRWSEARRDVRLGVSSQYLPDDMQAYAPLLDESGDWRQTESYGYAWYPRVAPDWRPYYYGRWDSYPRYGWTWIGADRFAWPTHHYGRWGFSAGAWFWVPSSRWAPAYVSWAYAPGYVSWCPLGFDDRPIFAINVFRSGYSPWRGWTALSYSHFAARGYLVNQRAVNWDRFGGQRPRFEQRPSSPGFARDVAVPRNSTPIRWAGSRNLPRQGGGPSRGDAPRDNSSRANPRLAPSATRDAGRDVATPRTGANPRYVNRGDEIIRSQTERPSPAAGSRVTRPEGGGFAIPRQGGGTPARPEGADRPAPIERSDAAPRTVPDPSAGSGAPRATPRSDGTAPPSRSESTPIDAAQGRPRVSGSNPSYQPYQPYAPSRPAESPRAEPRGDGARSPRVSGGSPAYQPPGPSTAAGAPRAEPRPEPGPGRPRAYERPAAPEGQPYSGGQARPAPEREAPRAAPAERAPNRGEGRQPAPSRVEGPAPERAAPAPRSAPPPSGGGGVAVPRRGRGGA